MKLMITKIIPNQTSGEASPVTPVQDQACARFAVSDAPRLSSSSETNTHPTLSASCNQGLANPEGRSRISYRYQRCDRQERIKSLLTLILAFSTKAKGLQRRFLESQGAGRRFGRRNLKRRRSGWAGGSAAPRAMPNMNAASPPNFSIELVTGRVHPTGGQGTARSTLRQRANVIVAFGRALKLIGVWKTPQHRIMTRRLKIFDGAPEDQVKGRSGVHDVKIERHQITAEVQLRIVIQRAAAIRL